MAFGIGGPRIKKFNGLEYEHVGTFESKEEADYWAENCRQYGNMARVEANPEHRCFDLFARPKMGSQGAPQPAPKE